MKTVRCFVVTMVVWALVLIPMPAAVQADNDDFTVSYVFSPHDVGPKGADMRLTLTVTNTGSTDITWIGVGIDTAVPFSGRWNGSPAIHPGTHRTLTFTVPFQQGDINETRLMQVTMNNNAAPAADGSISFRFSIHGVERFVVPASSIVIPPSGFHAGDEVTVTLRYRNECTTHPALHFRTDAWLTKDGTVLNNVPEVDHGMLAQGGEVTRSFTYTLRDSDTGTLIIHSRARYTLMGRTYDDSNTLGHISVASAAPEMDFTASLTAEPREIHMGDTVHFRITVQNTGGQAIDRFQITCNELDVEMEADGMAVGASGSITVDKRINESCDIRFAVRAYAGDRSVLRQTNDEDIFVSIAAVPFSSPSVAPSSSSPPLESAAPAAAETPSPSVAGDIASASPLPEALPTPAAGAQPSPDGWIPGIPSVVLYIIIGALVVAVAVLVIVLILRRRKKAP